MGLIAGLFCCACNSVRAQTGHPSVEEVNKRAVTRFFMEVQQKSRPKSSMRFLRRMQR
jgi:hypothetical protein